MACLAYIEQENFLSIFMFDVTSTFLMVFIDSMNLLFSYVNKEGEIWTVSFLSTKDQEKKITPNKAMTLLCLGP
jgi:isoprenylcysteine carboxyl methyltransferase (ICMT) family protein YpbQ